MLVSSAIESIVEEGGTITFYMSDGTTITMGRIETVGMYALSEGSFGGGNGQLVYFDYKLAANKFVRNNEKRFQNYGETPNDLLVYGSKMYCAITGNSGGSGSMVRVINTSTGETIRDIAVQKESTTFQPRRLAAHDGKVYVSLYSGAVAEIDTASYSTKLATIGGTFSEGICVYGQSLYICNSGQGTDNTISIVSLASFTETGKITVPYNPISIVSAGNGELYFNTASVWSGPAAGAPANVHVLNVASKQVTKTFNLPLENIVAGRHYIYGTATDWADFSGILKKISITDKTVSDFTGSSNAGKLMFAYKLSVNRLNGDLFLTQQMGQDVNRFREDGTHLETLKTGQQNGAAIAFVSALK